jgi:hypothetical protein
VLKLRVDPWATEYEGSIFLDKTAEEPPVPVDPFVETEDWRPIWPESVERPQHIVFVDGVQRVEVRVIGEQEGALVYGAFASLAVGAAVAQPGSPTVAAEPPQRALALADGASTEPVSVPCGSLVLEFQVQSTPTHGNKGVREALDNMRRDAETNLGRAMVDRGHPLVVMDGRLRFQPTRRSMAVGLAKTLHALYLSPPQSDILGELPVGSRTPIFAIQYETPVYSWYIRLAERRPIDHFLASVVRLETMAGIGLEAAARLADLTALHLPGFASSPAWDPRAPQNLYPVAALENHLHHLLGDHEWIRRAIEGYLYRGGA